MEDALFSVAYAFSALIITILSIVIIDARQLQRDKDIMEKINRLVDLLYPPDETNQDDEIDEHWK